ncbi:MAG: PHP domain-containing protein [Candidatus Bathyarchaeota archaeon]|nr:MAG: PHP domain-containing protein [Candidatus Bathyarchaeota archaeon]
MVLVDLHIHTVYSGDSTIRPKLIVDQLHAHPMFEGVAITDHNTLDGYFRTLELAKVYKDLKIFPGIEIATSQGDITILGVEEKPKLPMTLESATDFAKETYGAIVIPHPFRSMGIGDLTFNIEAHAIEVLNPTATLQENTLAQELAKTKGLPGIAGTDAHNASEMWTVSTEIKAQPADENIIESIRKGKARTIIARKMRL